MVMFLAPSPQHCFFALSSRKRNFVAKISRNFAKIRVFRETKFREINMKISRNMKGILSRNFAKFRFAKFHRPPYARSSQLPASRKFGKITQNQPPQKKKLVGQEKLTALRSPFLVKIGLKLYFMKNMYFSSKI
jgi:hypothetical protein